MDERLKGMKYMWFLRYPTVCGHGLSGGDNNSIKSSDIHLINVQFHHLQS